MRRVSRPGASRTRSRRSSTCRAACAVEDRFGPELASELEARGHDVRHWPQFTRDAAAVEAIFSDASSGFLRAGADPRQPAYAIVS